MTAPAIYNAHPVTGEYIGNSFADPDPLTPGDWLVPAHASTEMPPNAGSNQAAVLSGAVWGLVPDYRGVFYWDTTGERHQITVIGIEPPKDSLLDPPARAPLSLQETQTLRLEAYRTESDPLKIEAEYDSLVFGSAPDYTAWLNRVAEIKARYPLPL